MWTRAKPFPIIEGEREKKDTSLFIRDILPTKMLSVFETCSPLSLETDLMQSSEERPSFKWCVKDIRPWENDGFGPHLVGTLDALIVRKKQESAYNLPAIITY